MKVEKSVEDMGTERGREKKEERVRLLTFVGSNGERRCQPNESNCMHWKRKKKKKREEGEL